MNTFELIMTRKSIRTFDGRPLAKEDLKKLCDRIAAIRNPYDIPVEFVLLDAKEHGLSSPVIVGEPLYIAAKVKIQPHCEEAYGYSFEEMVLHAWSFGIGTTWIGGTMDRKLFENAVKPAENECMMIVSPLGYPAESPSEVDRKLRSRVLGDTRFPAEELFFDKNFETPLVLGDEKELFEAVRWAPSAANLQPCRVVKDKNRYHFYKKHIPGYTRSAIWDVQKIDAGIALCHFMRMAGGRLEVSDPGTAADKGAEYIATVVL